MKGKRVIIGFTVREWILIGLFMAGIAAAAVLQTVQGREGHYKEFIRRAEIIGRAMEAFARDHQGRYPGDGQNTQSPPGLSPNYLEWKEEWNIDYEVHENGRGGKYIALEYLGLYKPGQTYHSSGLTRDPEKRRLYGKGQRIPGSLNRIWVYYEEAPIFE